ncbi:MAG: Ig-like domain-containing protein [candidate division Zixibacteria bacterium]
MTCSKEDDITGSVDLQPGIYSTVPTQGSTNVPINSVITATFSEVMTPGSINDTTFLVEPEIAGVVNYANKVATFTPTNPLPHGYQLTARVTKEVTDLAGNHMAADFVWGFSTELALPDLWEKTYGQEDDELAYAVVPMIDGGFVVAGRTASLGAGSNDAYLFKVNSGGIGSWETTFGGEFDDVAFALDVTPTFGFVLTGESYSFEDSSLYIIRTNPTGGLLWDSAYGFNAGKAVAAGSDGSVTVAGHTDGFNSDPFVFSTDSSGVMLFDSVYSGPSVPNSVRVQSIVGVSDGYVVAGQSGTTADIYLFKIDLVGNMLWQKTYGGSGDDAASAIIATSDGGFVIAGATTSSGAGSSDALLMKLSAGGDSLWALALGGSEREQAYAVVEATDGGFVLAGFTESFGTSGRDVYLAKANASGVFQWQETYGHEGHEEARSLARTNEGGYLIAGYTNSPTMSAGGFDIYLLKVNSRGQQPDALSSSP